MKRLTHPSCFLLLVLLSTSVAASVLLFNIGVTCHNVFVSTFMLVARSNRTVAYVVFNFISLTIFLGFLRSAKPITSGDIDRMFIGLPLPEHSDHQIMLIEGENKEGGDSDEDEDNEYHGYDGYEDGYEEDNDDDMESEEDEDSEAEEGDSDLERRSDEFIAKMNSKWREELQHEGLLCMVYASAPKLGLL